jgi:hypothetical protein
MSSSIKMPGIVLLLESRIVVMLVWCRDYRQVMLASFGTACMQGDGVWDRVKRIAMAGFAMAATG